MPVRAGSYPNRFIDGKSKREHIVIAEKILGRPLPAGAVVHHVDEDKTNNRNDNLVICPDRAYHNLIHRRMRAYDACGHADWLKCCLCGKYDDPRNMRVYQSPNENPRGRHASCELERGRHRFDSVRKRAYVPRFRGRAA